ncbi:nuclear pore complex protein NUP1 isoform X3 [Dioscorea cayenensis subsp. rotundata]|uniref:Nuclear pore complex protein NUP1 isoform X3 n=1 Tax=Dioscorea cayennensis subsp. rotundata TaxID=55577 RepID=A0AB40CZP3_DIOCR|nr:nuclear pore complex protein NUP1 isoform X3 [Dioscorea cayenensis subsp. rotundata]
MEVLSRSAADGVQEQSEGADGQQSQRITASAQPPMVQCLSKLLAQPAPRPRSPFFSLSQQRQRPYLSSLVHTPGVESPQDYEKLFTLESHHYKKEQTSSLEASLPKVKPESNDFAANKPHNAHEERGLAEIEQLLKQKIFTRDESSRLVELLRSRTTDLSYVDDRAPKVAEAAIEAPPQKDVISLRKQNNTSQPDQMMKNGHDTLLTTGNTEVGSSPVDIAKAYMQALAATSGIKSQSARSKSEKNRSNDVDYASELSFSPAIKAPTRWPGAVLKGDLGCCTPQTQRSSAVLQIFSQSPYSHTLVSRYTSKSQVGDRNPNAVLAELKQFYTPLFGANTTMKRKSSILDDDLKSIGISRLVRQKNVASTVADPPDVQNSLPYLSESSEILEGCESICQRNAEHVLITGDIMMRQPSGRDENKPAFFAGSSTVHPRSSEIARKILDDISRTVPSPKEKALELTTAITRIKIPSISTNLVMDSKQNPPIVSAAANQFADCLIKKVDRAQETVHTNKLPACPCLGLSSIKDLASSYPQGAAAAVHLTAKNCPSFSDHDSILKSLTDGIPSKEAKLSGESSKPIDDGKLKISDNGSGFTFPVPVDTVAFSEPPPTPTLFPLAAENKNFLGTEGIPAFTFGTSGAGSGLVFSFAGSSANADFIGTSASKFHFGSDKKRLSFTAFGKNTVCCSQVEGRDSLVLV